MKTCDLKWGTLDYWVGKAEGLDVEEAIDGCWFFRQPDRASSRYEPTADWALAGPIIERERITIASPHDDAPADRMWQAVSCKGSLIYFGSTPLIAAMRCYVTSKFGEEV